MAGYAGSALSSPAVRFRDWTFRDWLAVTGLALLSAVMLAGIAAWMIGSA
jgi:hypothetical protein